MDKEHKISHKYCELGIKSGMQLYHKRGLDNNQKNFREIFCA